jgi:hypothetical protein
VAALIAAVLLVTAKLAAVSVGNPVVSAAARAKPDITLTATAAAGGLVKAGRWAPLIVAIDSEEDTFEGDLIVSWGDARVRRQLSFASRGRRELDLYLRTSNPENRIQVRLLSHGVEVQRTDVKVRVVEQTDPITLCVMAPDGVGGEGTCTAMVQATLLPSSMRGYESVDRLVWSAAAVRLSQEQQVALNRWQSIRPLELSGDLALAPLPSSPTAARGLSRPSSLLIAGMSMAFVLCLASAAMLGRRRRTPAHRVWGVVGGTIVLGSVAASAIGSWGPRGVEVRHASLLQQIPGSSGSILTIKGLATFPGFGRYTLQFHVPDASVVAATGDAGEEALIDESGAPVITGTYGLGGRQSFAGEAVVDFELVSVTREGSAWTISNRSQMELTRCQFSEGFSRTEIGTLAPGSSVIADEVSDGAGPAFTCFVRSPVVSITAGDRDVNQIGTTVLAVYGEAGEIGESALAFGSRLETSALSGGGHD